MMSTKFRIRRKVRPAKSAQPQGVVTVTIHGGLPDTDMTVERRFIGGNGARIRLFGGLPDLPLPDHSRADVREHAALAAHAPAPAPAAQLTAEPVKELTEPGVAPDARPL